MKVIAVAALAVGLLAIGGVGFAWGGGGGCDDHGGHHGGCRSNPQIDWTNPTATGPSVPGISCTVSFSPSLLTEFAYRLVPGSLCYLNGTLTNTGQVPVDLVPHISASLPHGCPAFTYSDNLLSALHQVSLNPGRSFAYKATIAMTPAAGAACEGAHAQFQVTITADGSSSCEGFAAGPQDDDGGCCG